MTNLRKYNSTIFLLVTLILFGCKKTDSSTIKVHIESIPGSKYHEQNGTWWGYNQQKIVRFENKVFMTIVDNDNLSNGLPNANNPSTVYLYCKTGNGPWVKGAGVPTSRPANILVDSKGCIHLIVFEPTETDPTENGSLGKLKHYSFPNAKSGDIFNHTIELIVDHTPGTAETVNIRIGASISADDILYVSFGLYQDLKLYSKQVDAPNWTEEMAGQNLGNSYYYPFVLGTPNGPCVLAVQDDYVGPGLPAIYYKNKFFHRFNGTWTNQTMCDLSAHPLAATRNRLVDNCELFLSSSNKVIGIYQKLLDPSVEWKSSYFQLEIDASGQTTETPIPLDMDDINRIRLIEHQGILYYLCIKFNGLFIKKGLDGSLKEINLPSFASGNYMYLSNSSGGSSINSNYIDILLLNGNAQDYPNGTNHYARINKCELEKL
jgi:hypothetical protein